MSAKYDEKKAWQSTAEEEMKALQEELAELKHQMKTRQDSVGVEFGVDFL